MGGEAAEAFPPQAGVPRAVRRARPSTLWCAAAARESTWGGTRAKQAPPPTHGKRMRGSPRSTEDNHAQAPRKNHHRRPEPETAWRFGGPSLHSSSCADGEAGWEVAPTHHTRPRGSCGRAFLVRKVIGARPCGMGHVRVRRDAAAVLPSGGHTAAGRERQRARAAPCPPLRATKTGGWEGQSGQPRWGRGRCRMRVRAGCVTRWMIALLDSPEPSKQGDSRRYASCSHPRAATGQQVQVMARS